MVVAVVFGVLGWRRILIVFLVGGIVGVAAWVVYHLRNRTITMPREVVRQAERHERRQREDDAEEWDGDWDGAGAAETETDEPDADAESPEE